jgi:hypothetical protein
MLLVATTWPFGCAAIVEAEDSEFTDVEELVIGKVAEPDIWLARDVLGALMPFNLSMISIRA